MINILMGKSSCGKDYILKKLVSEHNYIPLVSITTRPMRDGEVDGKDYYFTTKQDFINVLNNNGFIEHREYNTLLNNIPDVWYYGLPKMDYDNDKNYIVILDVKGTKEFIDYVGINNCKLFLIETPTDLRRCRAMFRGGYDKFEFDRRLIDDKEVFSFGNIVKVFGDIYSEVKVIDNYEITYLKGKVILEETDIDNIIKEIL